MCLIRGHVRQNTWLDAVILLFVRIPGADAIYMVKNTPTKDLRINVELERPRDKLLVG